MDMVKSRQQLIDRLTENFANYHAELLTKDRQELIDGADRIAKTAEVFQYFTERPLTESEVAYFLNFQNPLEVAVDHWENCTFELDALGAVIADAVDKEADLTLYPLTADTLEQKVDSLQAPIQEAVYLVDRGILLHMKEVQGGEFEYAVFDKQTKGKTAEGKISGDDVMDGIDPTHGHLAAARDAALERAGLDGIEVAKVGLTSLKEFPASDVRRRQIWKPETLPKNDICFIDSHHNEQFRIPDGGTIQVEYPDEVVSVRCEYHDDYHACIGAEMYHMYQFADSLERSGGVCRPEPVLDAYRAAWNIGIMAYLAVECGAGHWDYKLMDAKFNEIKSGELEAVGLSINEVRNLILVENNLERRPMRPTDYGLLMEKAAQKEMDVMQKQSKRTAKKPSIKAQLSVKPIPGEPPAKPKDKEAR